MKWEIQEPQVLGGVWGKAPIRMDAHSPRYVTLNHPMTKAHFIRFIACVGMERVLLVRLYLEQNAEVRMPKMPHATWYIGCSEDGLYTCRLK